MRYTVLLVDDEAEIREGIIKKIDWEKYGFEIIGSAENGNDALEIAELKQPDVVMTDVMMPFMDGLELGEKLVSLMPSVKLIVFSGADDFEYVQKALRLQAVEYVLKPIDAMELGETLMKLKNRLDEEYEKRRNLETLRKHYIDSIPVIREQFLVNLVEGRMDKEQVEKKSGIGQIDLDAWGYTVALLQIEPNQDNKIKQIFKRHDEALVPVTLKQVVDEMLPSYVKMSSFYYRDTVGTVVSLYKESGIFKLIKGMNEICKVMEKVYGLVVTAGIGKICKSPLELRNARKEAETALSYRISFGSGRAIYLGDVEPKKTSTLQFGGNDEVELIAAIKVGNEEEIRVQIDKIFLKNQDYMASTLEFQVYLIEVKVAFVKLMQYYDLEEENIFKEMGSFQMLDGIYSLSDVKEWMLEKSLQISQKICDNRMNTVSAITIKAKEYVKEHYADEELSVDYMSQILHVSSSYFSTLFKKEEGVTFITYLTDIRMKKAVELLDMTDDKSYIIAEKIGYSDPNYFSYVFKKHQGVSPQRYRKRK